MRGSSSYRGPWGRWLLTCRTSRLGGRRDRPRGPHSAILQPPWRHCPPSSSRAQPTRRWPWAPPRGCSAEWTGAPRPVSAGRKMVSGCRGTSPGSIRWTTVPCTSPACRCVSPKSPGDTGPALRSTGHPLSPRPALPPPSRLALFPSRSWTGDSTPAWLRVLLVRLCGVPGCGAAVSDPHGLCPLPVLSQTSIQVLGAQGYLWSG